MPTVPHHHPVEHPIGHAAHGECQGSTGTGVNHQPEPCKHQPDPESQESSGAIHHKRAGEGTRTPNLLFTRQLRYRLRHASTTAICPSRRASSCSRGNPHQASTSCCVCIACAIRLAAPFTAFWAMVPTRCPYTSAVIAMPRVAKKLHQCDVAPGTQHQTQDGILDRGR